MPYLRFKGFPSAFIHELSPRIVSQFARMVHVQEHQVKIECMASEAITTVPPTLEILLFPRSPETHDAVATFLHTLLGEAGYPDVHLYYIFLDPRYYYKKGSSLEALYDRE